MQDFVYTSAHLDALKKYKFSKMLFLLLGCLVLLLQSMAWIIVWYKDIAVNTTNKVFVTITLVVSFLFIFSQCFFVVHTKKIIKNIKLNGTFVTKRPRLIPASKPNLINAMAVFARILAIVLVILLGVFIVSFIENYLNWGKVILKMPIIVLIAIAFLNYSLELRYDRILDKAGK